MKSIYSLFQVCENVKVRKTNVNELIKTLKAEIYTASIQLHKAQNLNYYKDIFALEEKKKFLEEYPCYLKKGVRGLLKNILSMFQTTGILFIIILVGLFLMQIKYGFCIEMVWLGLLLSAGISLYGTFIEPIIYNYKRKKEILDEFQNEENIEIEIEKLKNKQQSNEEHMKLLKQEMRSKEKRVEQLSSYYHQLEILEEQSNEKFHNAIDSIWNDLAHEYYLYEDNLLDSNTLKLTK